MKRKAKGLLQLLFFIGVLLILTAGFFLWDASRQAALTSGDRLLLSREQTEGLVTTGINLYNSGKLPVVLESVQVDGTGWELSAAEMTDGLLLSNQPLSQWAAEHNAVLTPVRGFRISKDQSATLGISLRRTVQTTAGLTRLVIKYRSWFVTHELELPLS